MEGRINAAPIRKWAIAELGLTSNMYWAVQNRLVAENRIELTKDKTRNANHMSPEDARVLIDELKAHPSAKDSGAPLPPEIAAAGNAQPPPPPPPPKKAAAKTPTAAELAAREGPKGATPAKKPTDPPAPSDDDPPPEPRKRVQISKNAWKWIVLVGVGCVGIAAARSWYTKRKATQQASPAAVPSVDAYSPEALREDLLNQGFKA